jgi:hypothetical protein
VKPLLHNGEVSLTSCNELDYSQHTSLRLEVTGLIECLTVSQTHLVSILANVHLISSGPSRFCVFAYTWDNIITAKPANSISTKI